MRNAALTDTSVDLILDLYPNYGVVILNRTEEAITEDVVCIHVALPVARVVERPTKRIEWLEVETINQDVVRLKPIVLINVIGMSFFNDSTAKVLQLTVSTKSSANQRTANNGEQYVIYRVALYANISQQNK